MSGAPVPTARRSLLAGYLALAMGIGPLAHYTLSALGPLVVDDLDLSATQFGGLWLVAFGAAAIGTPFVSRLTDSVGPQRMLRWTFLCAVAAFVVISVSGSSAVLLVGVALAGCSVAISNPATNLAIAQSVERGRQGVMVGAKQSGVQGGQLLAGLALPGIAVWIGWRPTMVVCVVLGAIGVFGARWLVGASQRPAGRSAPTPARMDPTVWWLAGYALVVGAIIQAANVYLPLYAHAALGQSVGTAGLVAAVLGGAGVVARLGWGRLVDQVKNTPMLLLCLALVTGLGLAFCAVAERWSDSLIWVGAGIFGFSALAANAVIMSAVVGSAAPGSVGRASGWVSLGLYLGFMVGPITFGLIVDSTASYAGGWFYLGALAAVLVVLTTCWSVVRRYTKFGRVLAHCPEPEGDPPMSAVLLAVLHPEPPDAGAFYSWYEAEHVTGRLGMPGFTDAHRYRTEGESDRGILIYELDGMQALATSEYQALQSRTAEATKQRMGGLRQFVRVTGKVVQEHGEATGAAPLLFVVAFAAPAEDLGLLDAWYRDEHVPALLEAESWLGVRIIDVADSNVGWTRVAIHRLADRSALSSKEREAAGETPGRERLAERPWFGKSARFVADGVERFDDAVPMSHG